MTSTMTCLECAELERVHDECLERYVRLAELQTRLFKKGYPQAGRDLDAQIQRARDAREQALDLLLNHSADVEGHENQQE